MSDPLLRLMSPEPLFADRSRVPLGRILVDQGHVTATQVMQAAAVQRHDNVRLGDVLLAQGLVTQEQIYRALAQQCGAQFVDLNGDAPQPHLLAALDPADMLRLGFVPWTRIGGLTVCATSRPELFSRIEACLPEAMRPALLAIATEETIHQVLGEHCGTTLARRAEARVPEALSCRRMDRGSGLFLALALVMLAGLCALAPATSLTVLAVIATVTLLAATTLKLAAFIAQMTAKPRDVPLRGPPGWRRPIISVMVPLHRERAIAQALLTRLSRLQYPRHLLDIVLVVEATDTTTQEALSEADLPHWMRVITVPPGHPQTKPRALNYALDFCKGEIVGIYDAEDAPAPDQLEQVARRFRDASRRVACLQGVLDYYNPHDNWLARCFTLEYATWFRVVLPGMARLGLAIPLGGTTLFFRRRVLDELGGWDAHNVTEDADLGMRLARRGYRTELIDTVTQEEANCRVWPWVRQRSRWLKGYMATYLVHMRQPRRLLRQLGLRKFVGFQVFFLSTLSQFLLAPVLWCFWLYWLGLLHPMAPLLEHDGLVILGLAFLGAEILGIAVSVTAAARAGHRSLMKWAPTQMLYFPLGALAAYKALFELVTKPFYWDKTDHGHSLSRRRGRPPVPAE